MTQYWDNISTRGGGTNKCVLKCKISPNVNTCKTFWAFLLSFSVFDAISKRDSRHELCVVPISASEQTWYHFFIHDRDKFPCFHMASIAIIAMSFIFINHDLNISLSSFCMESKPLHNKSGQIERNTWKSFSIYYSRLSSILTLDSLFVVV